MAAAETQERPGTRAQVRYARMSASKARVVLNLIRGKRVIEASQVLAFSERLAADVIGKCLRSAVANAEHNEDIPASELYISACFADEGPSLRRFRPRARGRAGRIRKQTCHITIEVSRYSDDELDEMRRRAEQRSEGSGSATSDAAADRRRRVAKSRKAEEVADDEVAADEASSAESTAAKADAPLQAADDDTKTDTVEESSAGSATADEDGAQTDETEEES